MPTRRGLLMLLAVALSLAAIGTGGCATGSTRSRTCALILLIDGKHMHPTNRQFSAVERKLGAMFAERGMILVPDLPRADLLATIELRPQPERPTTTDLVVVDVSPNTFQSFSRAFPGGHSFPTISASDRELAHAPSGFSRSTPE